MKILLLSAYHAQSHAYWAERLITLMPEHDWQLLTLSPRFFAWRLRGNALSFKQQYHQQLQQNYDVVIATSMTDLAMLKALYPTFNNSHCVLYFHENQFAYPKTSNQQLEVEQQMLSIYSAEVADELVFNSEFNRQSFFQGVGQLLKKLPDGVDKHLADGWLNKSCVLAVPILLPQNFIEAPKPNAHLHIAWAARWEYDKGPELLLAIVKALVAKGLFFTIHIVGQSFRKQPEAFAQLKNDYGDYIGQFGFIDNQQDYWRLLASCDIFLSTAHHEFYGISVAEAQALGCQLLLPNVQVYPSLYQHQACFYEDANHCAKLIAAKSKSLEGVNKKTAWQAANKQQQQLINSYRHWLNNISDND